MLVESLFKGFTVVGSEWVLWILIGLSFVSTAVVVAKWKSLSRIEKVGLDFWNAKVEGWIAGDSVPLSDAETEQLAVQYPCLEAKIVKVLQKAKNNQSVDRDKIAEGIIIKERILLEKQLSFLGTLGSNAPFIGLFGTVLGIIKAFADLNHAQSGAGGMGSVMAGLSEALVATAVGLLVAIPSVIFYNLFQKKVKTIVQRTQSLAAIIVGRG
jgi:biopolymer transport protein ExbB